MYAGSKDIDQSSVFSRRSSVGQSSVAVFSHSLSVTVFSHSLQSLVAAQLSTETAD